MNYKIITLLSLLFTRDGLVVTPSRIPNSCASLICSRFAFYHESSFKNLKGMNFQGCFLNSIGS